MPDIQCFAVEPTGTWTEPNENGVSSHIYRRLDNGELYSAGLPVGAMWLDTDFGDNSRAGADGLLVVVTPGGWWYPDYRATNCTRPDDDVHRCWCRHGEVPRITVDKIGNSCQAGGGSILIGGYHGFLIDGILKSA